MTTLPSSQIELRGGRARNLKCIDVDIPLGKWTAVVGPSGSGKSSLAFHTIFKEGQRRYLGSFSPHARQFMEKLGRPEFDSLTNLPVAIAVGQGSISPNPRSTVGTITGLLDPLRLLFARQGHFDGADLTRSSFSFNVEAGWCEHCRGLGVVDRVEPALLVESHDKSIRQGALRPTLKNGYTVYSQVTLEVMNTICEAHGFTVDTPWCELDERQREVIFYGTKALLVPFGKHSIESRMRWEGITARPRDEGYYRGLIPVIEETLKRDRNPNILRFVQSVTCECCGGSRLGVAGREAKIQGVTLPQLANRPISELMAGLDSLPESPVLTSVKKLLDTRLRVLAKLGLGHLSLDRESTTLSQGEGQRLRLTGQLAAALGGMVVVLDEPTLGVHPSGLGALVDIIEELLDAGNTVVTVEHNPSMAMAADWQIAMGPEAGPAGGHVVWAGAPKPIAGEPKPKAQRRSPRETVWLTGASKNNLQGVDFPLHSGIFTVVAGPSGAGKSSLIFGCLLPALESGALTFGQEKVMVEHVDAKPIGKSSRSTPATYSGAMELIRKRFAQTDEAKALGFRASHFSHNSKDGRCGTCEGLGYHKVGLHLLADVELECETCRGSRYSPQTMEVVIQGEGSPKNIAEVLAMNIDQACEFFDADDNLSRLLSALRRLGLGYLTLGRSSTTLSGGEAQRIKLAKILAKASSAKPRSQKNLEQVLLLDEPDRGLHPKDLARLLSAIQAIVDSGISVVAISHSELVWEEADCLITLDSGRVIPPSERAKQPSISLSRRRSNKEHSRGQITLLDVTTNNLQIPKIEIPQGVITAITGVSGSGKSSLAFSTLAAESWLRFSESLPFYARRFMKKLPNPSIASACGLSPVVSLRQLQTGESAKASSLAIESQIDAHLRLLFSRLGKIGDSDCGLSAGHFSPNNTFGACGVCSGKGEVHRCTESSLVSDPSLPISLGAMGGTRAGRFFTEPDGQYIATLQAAAKMAELSVDGPWSALTSEAKALVLDGSGDQSYEVNWQFKRGKRAGEHHFSGPWLGLVALVEAEARKRANSKRASEWAAALEPERCRGCDGERLSPVARQALVRGKSLPQLYAMTISNLVVWLQADELFVEQSLPTLSAILGEVNGTLGRLVDLGLGGVSLRARVRDLSSGQVQLTRIATLGASGLTGLTVVLDEPATGLDLSGRRSLLKQLRGLTREGNTVVIVSHLSDMIAEADWQIELGPGAGALGGQVVYAGLPQQAQTPHETKAKRVDASADTIDIIAAEMPSGVRDFRLPREGVIAITGANSSGKSRLLFDILARSVEEQQARGCEAIRGAEGIERVVAVGERGISQHSSPLTFLGLQGDLQKLYFSVSDGSIKRQAFSFLSPAGRCEQCKGAGFSRVSMDFIADLRVPCDSCGGDRYRAEVLETTWQGLNVSQFLQESVSTLAEHLPKGLILSAVERLNQLGLGYLSLGRDPSTLSGGERQRLALVRALTDLSEAPTLFAIEEPSRGLHDRDLISLGAAFHEISQRGDLIVYTSQREAMLVAADWVVEL